MLLIGRNVGVASPRMVVKASGPKASSTSASSSFFPFSSFSSSSSCSKGLSQPPSGGLLSLQRDLLSILNFGLESQNSKFFEIEASPIWTRCHQSFSTSNVCPLLVEN